MAKKQPRKKVVKSFKELSHLNRRELFVNQGLIPLDKRYAVSIARQLAEGFDFSLQKEPSKRQYTKARKIITEFYDHSRLEKTKLIRPSKKNRKYYARKSTMSGTFKVYFAPVSSEDDEYVFKKSKKGKKKLIRKSKHVTYEDFEFEDREEFAKNPVEETQKLLDEIDDAFGKNKVKTVFVTVGEWNTRADFSTRLIPDILKEWTLKYGQEKSSEFIMGLRTATFRGQSTNVPSRLALKTDVKKKTARNKRRFK